ncbi:MAG: F0F1 ATP synthase subunit A [Bacteroidota bacterium]|jgi:F-type H+-transporting ATPase subunit a
MLNKINTFRIVFSLLLTCLFLSGASTAIANDSTATHATAEHEHSSLSTESHEAADAAGAEHGEEKFNAGKMILEHVGDAHDWHIAGHLSIPLPVIIYSEAGLDLFSSSRFEHGHATYHSEKTNINYKLEENKVVAVNEDGSVNEERTANFFDLSITKNVATLLFSVILLCWLFISVAKSYLRNPGKAPKGIQSFVEPIIIFIRDDVAKASIGEKKYKKFMPYLLTVFFFIWINNLLGLIPIFPGGANLTGNVAVTLTLASLTFIITVISANKHYWHHIFAMPGVPAWVLIILTPIEILGLFLRPFVLMVRLFANITAGHIIALSFFSLIFIFGEMNTGAGLGFSLFSTAFTVFMMVMELLVAFLQAYVFTLLSAVYFGTAVEEGHHEEAHAH